MLSSILNKLVAASSALFKLLIFEMVGSRTPACRLSRTSPLMRSRPYIINPRFESPTGAFCAALWYARSLATRSVLSLAALMARVFGMVRSAEANSAMASCSREP